MRVNGVSLNARIFLLLAGRSSGSFPSYKKNSISLSSLGETLTRNKCASGKSSFIAAMHSLVSSQDR
jgi:hypothetical protein